MCHINHHQTSHWSSPPFIQSNDHSPSTLISLLGGHNFDGPSWSEAASKWAASEFLPTPPNQNAPVQSCPMRGKGSTQPDLFHHHPVMAPHFSQ
jgi:hypothetical protein